MKEISLELQEEKSKRKYLEQEVSLLKNEKNSLEEFYKNLLENHKNMIKQDIERSEKGWSTQVHVQSTKNETHVKKKK